MRKSRNSDGVSSSHNESEEEEQEQSVDDSEEDWQPEKVGEIMSLKLFRFLFTFY